MLLYPPGSVERCSWYSERNDANASGAGNSFAERLGPVRGGQRENKNGGKQSARTRNAPAKREKRKPVTAADLDAELEAFMNTPSNTAAAASSSNDAAVASSAQPASAQDVEMS